MKNLHFLALLGAFTGLAACNQGAEDDGAGGGGAVADACAPADPDDRGDCVAYEPATIEGSESGAWAGDDDHVRIPIEVTDPGGGLVTVTLSVTGTASEVVVGHQGAEEGTYFHGVGALTSDDRTDRSFTFRAQGDTTYELDVHPAFALDGEDTSWTVSWSYAPNVDCYEDNDTLATAKRIPVGVPIEAYAHAGITGADGLLVRSGGVDFYAFELTEPTTVRLRATKPSDTAITFELWDAETDYTTFVGTDMVAPGGVETESADLELPAGTHHVRVGYFVSQYGALTDDDDIPADWDTPYSFTVVAAGVASPDGDGETVACVPPAQPAANDHECDAYEPADLDGSVSGLWIDQPAVRVRLDVTDPGGGLVEVTMESPIAAGALVSAPGTPDEERVAIGDVFVADERSTRVAYFRAQGGRSYDLDFEVIGTPDGSEEFTLTWRYLPNVDCYEQNDTLATARRIPLDQPIEAYLHAGIFTNELLVRESGDDFYRFVLDQPTTVELLATKPSDTAITFDLWDPETDFALGGITEGAPGAELVSEPFELEAGVHFVRVGTFVSQDSSTTDDFGYPADWDEPYQLTIRTR